jgi:hypothetical protein
MRGDSRKLKTKNEKVKTANKKREISFTKKQAMGGLGLS